MTKTEMISNALINLRDKTGDVWSDDDLSAIIDQVAREISRKAGLPKRANLAITAYTKDVDLGSLAYIDINQVEYPVGNGSYEPIYRAYKQFGTTLSLDLETEPTVTNGTLTGTVTWTPGSRAVTGSSTLFTTELAEGYLIQVGKVADAAYKWYQIAHITSATALTLVEPFEEATTADTVSLTKYRDSNSCARVYYTGDYSVSTTSDMPAKFDELAIMGVVAHAATEYAADHVVEKLVDVTTKIGLANTQAGLATARLAQAATDLASSRTNMNISAITTDMASAETALDKATTDLAAGLVISNTVNVGGEVTLKYVETAKADIDEAKARIEKVKAYIELGNPTTSIAIQEINDAAGYINQAMGYMQIADRDLNTDRLVAAYQRWAEKKWNEYQYALSKVVRLSDHIRYNCPRG
jgi:hypothetical protein